MSSEELTLTAQLRTDSENITVTWSIAGTPGWAYRVKRDNIRAASDLVRTALERLIGGIGPGPDGKESAHANMRELSRAGMNLYWALMTGEKTLSAKTDSNAFREWFEMNCDGPNAKRYNIEIVVDEDAVVPWGLVFTPVADGALNNLSYTSDVYNRFWCMRHELACYSENQSNSGGLERDMTMLKLVVDKDLTNMIADGLEVFTLRDKLVERFRQHRNHNQLLYLSLPMDRTGHLVLAPDQLTPQELRQMGNDKAEKSIVFLDACSTIYGDQGNEWIDAFHKWDGFIGVEIDLMRPRAGHEAELEYISPMMRLFGLNLLLDIVESEETLGEMFPVIRRRYWPESLAYGLYCNPRMRWDPLPGPDFIRELKNTIDAIRP